MYFFSHFSSVASQATTVTRVIFHNAICDVKVSSVCAEIAQLAARLRLSTDDNERKSITSQMGALKRRLPAFCWHATFPSGKRANDGAIPSGLIMIDVDHIDDPKECFESIKEKALPLNLLAAHVTPSTMGLRLVFPIPQGMSLTDAQDFYASQLNLKVDNCAKDLARLSFLVPEPYWLFINEPALFTDDVCGVETRRATSQRDVCHIPPSEGVSSALNPDGNTIGNTPGAKPVATTYDTHFDNIPYTTIVSELCKLLGGEPSHGTRNNFIFTMANHLRSICDCDPDWIAQILPTYGEDETRWRNTINSACRNAKSHSISALMSRAIASARNLCCVQTEHAPSLTDSCHTSPLVGVSSALTHDGNTLDLPPAMPDRLPSLVSLIVNKVPEQCRPSLANGIFPPLATNMTGVTFRLLDNTIKEPTFMCVNIAKMGTGKSCINRVVPFIMSEIRKSDDESRRREQEWKDTNQQKGANRDKLKRPEGLCVQMLSPDMTNAALVQKLIDANGKYVYTNMDELELLKSLQTNGTRDVGKIICLAFDNGEYGQERVGSQSVTGKVPVRWNWNASTTIDRGRQFFRNRLIDGTLSRVNFCTIIPDETKKFKYGEFNEHFAQALNPYIENLRKETGLISCPKALALAERLQKEHLAKSDLADDEVYRSLTYRAVTIAYMKAIVLYIAQGNRWSKEIETFVEWSLQYDMWCKMHFFGEEFRQTNARENIRRTVGRPNLLRLMPKTFSYLVAFNIYKSTGKCDETAFRELLRKWTYRGYITLDQATGIYSKTPEYLAAHEA